MGTEMKTEVEVEYIFLQGHSFLPQGRAPSLIMLTQPKILLNLPVLKGMLPIVSKKLPEKVEYIRIDEIIKIVFKAGDKESMALVADVLDWAQPSSD